MLRFPLKQEILLVVDGEVFIGKIIFAAKDTLIVADLKKRYYDICDASIQYRDVEIANKFVFDRQKVIGYSYLDEEKNLDDIFNQNKKCGKLLQLPKKGDRKNG